jgi:hypothetical protein
VIINIKGMMIGNGVTRFDIDTWPAFVKIVHGFNLIPERLYEDYIVHKCKFIDDSIIPYNNS